MASIVRRGFGIEPKGRLRAGLGLPRLSRLSLRPAALENSLLGRLPRGAGIAASILFLGSFAAYGMVISGSTKRVVNDFSTEVGFGIQVVRISGQRQTSEQEILDLLGVSKHVSLLLYDVDKARNRVKAIPWISEVSIMKLFPDKLAVTISERVPYAIWQPDASVEPAIVDESGDIVATYVDPRFAGLPRVIGVGAENRAGEIKDLFSSVPTLRSRIKASVLVSGLRWDIFLTNGVRIMLPERDPQRALEEVARLDRESGLLSKSITTVDMRMSDRMVVRLTDEAKTWRDEMLAAEAKARKREQRA
ncbi:Cell division protein FtsQ [Hartmannibacter diazotrophicus]|uniref:Cell division protein FtsQ n=1 Tax=Hartmannibacter diazotrophicus TaxID=1482074 RepID=A0A2C9D859_9HYPH|nr:FtsQ-type POTRA domain-containing protein [Hartmannibacter diazotrophicus]SON56514.1 Cell division protein FtsQ [Hartmannibacter diazotrophicus]